MPVKVLIVEDEMIIAAKISMHLTNLGYEVNGIIPRGEEAILHCQEKFELLGDQLGVAKNLANIALIYYYQKDFNQALVYNQRCLDIY